MDSVNRLDLDEEEEEEEERRGEVILESLLVAMSLKLKRQILENNSARFKANSNLETIKGLQSIEKDSEKK